MRESLTGVLNPETIEETIERMYPDAEGEATSRLSVDIADDGLRPPRREEPEPDDDNVQVPSNSTGFGMSDAYVIPRGFGESIAIPATHPAGQMRSWTHGHGRRIPTPPPATGDEMASWGGR
jgi:hypothetical protein